jgi:putative ABC transport system ATP-binding protein
MIRIRGLEKNISFPRQGMVFLTGSDCAAKTDFLHMIAGLSEIDAGDVIVNDNVLAEMSEQERDAFRNTDIGIIFRENKLQPKMTVYQSLELVLNNQKWEDKTAESIRNHIYATLKAVGLEDGEGLPVLKLLEGERRRVLVARALVKDPKIVLADEPTADLKEEDATAVMEALKWASKTRLVIVASENRDLANAYADRELITENGRFMEAEENNAGSIMPPDDFSESIVTKENKKNTRKTENVLPPRYDVKAGTLSIRDRFRLAGMFRKGGKGHIFMVILAVLATLMTVYGMFYNEEKLLKGYFNKYQPENLKATLHVSYESDGDIDTADLSKGPYYLEKAETLAQETGHPLIPTIETSAYYPRKGEGNVSESKITLAALTETQQDIFPVTQGHFPTNYYQIVITDYLAGELGVSIGDDIETILGKFTVCGIISTDHAEYGLTEKLVSQRYWDYAPYLLKYRYAIGFVQKSTIDAYRKNGDYLNMNIPVSVPYLRRVITIGSISRFREDQLLTGRMPKEPNEVLKSIEMDILDISLKRYADKEAYDGSVDIIDSEYLNLAEFLPEGYKTVGYFDEDSVDFLIDDALYEKIRDRYIEDYFFDEYLLDCHDMTDYGALVERAGELGFRFEDPYADGVYYFKDTIRSISTVLWIITGLLGIVAIFIFESYFRATVQRNKEYFTDLRILGLTKKDISKIFTANALDLALTCVAITALLSVGVMTVFNLLFASDLSGRYYNVLAWNMPLTLCLIVVAVLILAMNWLVVKREVHSFSERE